MRYLRLSQDAQRASGKGFKAPLPKWEAIPLTASPDHCKGMLAGWEDTVAQRLATFKPANPIVNSVNLIGAKRSGVEWRDLRLSRGLFALNYHRNC